MTSPISSDFSLIMFTERVSLKPSIVKSITLKEIVESIDENAFVAIAPITEVKGGRFKKNDIH